MGGFEVRRNGVAIAVPDVAALRRLADTGALSAADEVRPEGGAWTPATAIPELRGRVRAVDDPFAAWADVDAVDPESIYRKMVEPVEELPEAAVAPRTTIVVRRPGDPEPLPLDSLTPVDAPAQEEVGVHGPPAAASAPPASPRAASPVSPGLVVPRPSVAPPRAPPGDAARRERRPGAAAPALPPDIAARFERPARPLESAAHRWRTAGYAVAALILGAGALVWVRTADLTVADDRARRAEAAPPAPATVSDAFIRMETEIRGRLPLLVRPIAAEGALSDALVLDLTQVGVSVVAAKADITRYVGRHRDEPKTVEIRVSFVGGELPRDVGAIVLVVGRYIRTYRLEVPVLELTEQSSGGKTVVDAMDAEAFYLGRVPLGKLLRKVAATPEG